LNCFIFGKLKTKKGRSAEERFSPESINSLNFDNPTPLKRLIPGRIEGKEVYRKVR
jgi:hypothetical protein